MYDQRRTSAIQPAEVATAEFLRSPLAIDEVQLLSAAFYRRFQGVMTGDEKERVVHNKNLGHSEQEETPQLFITKMKLYRPFWTFNTPSRHTY